MSLLFYNVMCLLWKFVTKCVCLLWKCQHLIHSVDGNRISVPYSVEQMATCAGPSVVGVVPVLEIWNVGIRVTKR